MAGLGEKIKQTVEHGVHKVKGKPAAGKRILIVTTSVDKYGDTDEPTGTWAEEVVAPYYIFKEAGAHVDVASIKGGKIPVDKVSLGEGSVTDHVKRYFEDEELKHYFENSLSVKDVPSNYDAIFIPGGHGIVFDGPVDKDFIALVEKFWADGKIVSAVCHGPDGLVAVRAPDGTPIVKGKKVAGFSNSEEAAVGATDKVPFLLEDKLKELGGHYEAGPDWVTSLYQVLELLQTLRELTGPNSTVVLSGELSGELQNDAVLEHFFKLALEDFLIGRVLEADLHPDFCPYFIV